MIVSQCGFGVSANCLKADPAYGKGVADALGIAWSDVPA
jgi:hypothetical protein